MTDALTPAKILGFTFDECLMWDDRIDRPR